jgi:hypothetical protein
MLLRLVAVALVGQLAITLVLEELTQHFLEALLKAVVVVQLMPAELDLVALVVEVQEMLLAVVAVLLGKDLMEETTQEADKVAVEALEDLEITET